MKGMVSEEINNQKNSRRIAKEPWFWSLMALLTFLLSHSSTFADWPLAIFALALIGCLLRLVYLARSPKVSNKNDGHNIT
jgi:hypothetical protein